MDSEYPFSIFWSLCCLIYRFWLLLWYLFVIVLSDIQILISPLVSFGHCVVWYTDSDCPFGIFWSLCCLLYRFWLPFGFFWSLCCLIYKFWFPLWYLLAIVLSDIQILISPLASFGHCVVWYTDSDYPLVSFGHCVVWYTDSDFPSGIFWSLCCLIYRFWFPLWYLLAIVLSVIQIMITLWFLLVIVLSDIQILIAPLVSFGHCVVCYTDSDYPLVSFSHCVVWYTDSDFPFGIFWSLCCLLYRIWLPFGIFWSLCCLIYRFWFPLCYLLVIVLSDIQIPITLWFLLVIVLSDIQILIAPLVSFGHCVVWYTDSDFPFGIFWSLCCLIYRFWFPLWYLLAIVLSVMQILITLLVSFGHCVVWYTDSDFPFGIFWPLCCLLYRFWLPFGFFWSLCCLIYRFWLSLLVSFGHCVVWYTDSDFPFGIFWSLCCLIYRFRLPFGIFWSLCCMLYRFWLPLWYGLAIVLSYIEILIAPLVSFGHCVVWYTDSDCPFGIFWSLCCLLYRFWFPLWFLLVIVLSDIQILISPLVSFGHCVVWYTDSDFPFGFFWSLCCLIYRFWFPLWYLLVILLSDIRIMITPWYLLVNVLFNIRILNIPLVSFGHCVVWYTESDCPFGIFWSLCCLIYRFWIPL